MVAILSDLPSPIAVGRTAEIYPWGDGRILKLTRPGFSPHLADQEWHIARLAWGLGAPVPRPFEILEVAGRRGVVFERLVGPTMARCMQRAPWRIFAYARQLGRLHVALHRLSAPGLPSQHERVFWNLEHSDLLPERLKMAVYQLVKTLPDNPAICHGDFHPENIIFTRNGPRLIDWEGCMHGAPAADVAATCLWIRTGLVFGKDRFVRWLGASFEKNYLDENERLAPGQIEHLESWLAVLAACQMREDKRGQFPHLLRLIEQAL
jgi:uncharacterized protein (TIGR02172 family)